MAAPRKRRVSSLEKNLILAALRDNNGSATKAARQLDISRSHFYRLLKEFDIR